MMQNLEKYVVIMGAQNRSGYFSIHGTGFLIAINNKAYSVTCRHVAISMCQYDVQFVIPNPKRTPQISTALLLSKPIYYNLNEPYVDICLMELSQYQASVLKANGINTISLDISDEIVNTINNDTLITYGYPGDTTSKYLSEYEPNISLPTKEIHGIATDWSIETELYHPQNTKNKDAYNSKSIQIVYTEDNIINIEGMSGGPVFQKETGRLCGILTGGQINAQLSDGKSANILLITPISYLIELLNRLI